MNNQNNELDLAVFLTKIYRFFYKNIKLLIGFLMIGVVLGITYDLVKKPYYETSVYATSALSYFETEEVDYKSKKIILDQQAIVDLVNNISVLVEDKELEEVSKKLNLPYAIAENIRHIEAEELFFVDGENIQQKRNKFKITLEVFSSADIPAIQSGLEYYINQTSYIQKYYQLYLNQSASLSAKISEEIQDLKHLRASVGQTQIGDYSEINLNNNNNTQTESQVVNLYIKKQQIEKYIELLKPISFFGNFSIPEKTENRLWVRIGIMSLLFLFTAIAISLIKYFNSKMFEE